MHLWRALRIGSENCKKMRRPGPARHVKSPQAVCTGTRRKRYPDTQVVSITRLEGRIDTAPVLELWQVFPALSNRDHHHRSQHVKDENSPIGGPDTLTCLRSTAHSKNTRAKRHAGFPRHAQLSPHPTKGRAMGYRPVRSGRQHKPKTRVVSTTV